MYGDSLVVAECLAALQEVVEAVFGHEVVLPGLEHRHHLLHGVFDVDFGEVVELQLLGTLVQAAKALLGLEGLGFDSSADLDLVFVGLLLSSSALPGHGRVLSVHIGAKKYISMSGSVFPQREYHS